MRSLQALIKLWETENASQLPSVPPSSVEETFASLNAVATKDVVYLYSQTGGMDNMTDAFWRHWPMAEIISENKQPSPFGLLFADYLISSWCYRVKPVSDSTSAVYVDHFDGNEPTLVAASLEQFFDDYLRTAGESVHGH